MEDPENSTHQFGNNSNHIDDLISDFEVSEKQNIVEKRKATLIDKKHFRLLFFGTGGVIYAYKQLPTLKTLSESNPQAVEALNALYDVCCDCPQLHWILNPGGATFQRIMAIALFFIPFSKNVVREYKDSLVENKVVSDVNKAENNSKPQKKETVVFDMSIFSDGGTA